MEKGLYAGGVNKMQHKTILSQGGTVHYWIARNDNVSDCIVFTHGLSKTYQKFTYQDTAEILHSILQKENIQKTFLAGMSMLKPLSKAEIIRQMRIAYEYFIVENKDVDFSFPILILVGEKDSTGKVKAYCKEWAKQTGYPLHFIKQAKHFANGDNPEQVNKEIEKFIIETVHKERKNYAVL